MSKSNVVNVISFVMTTSLIKPGPPSIKGASTRCVWGPKVPLGHSYRALSR